MGNVYTVTTTSDDSNSGLTLSEAINDANANPGSIVEWRCHTGKSRALLPRASAPSSHPPH